MVDLSLRNVSIAFVGAKILRNISLDLKTVEKVCILGKSGAGKSTLLRCISLLDIPDGGEMILGGRRVLHNKRVQDMGYLRKKISMVFQDYNLWPHKNALQNIIEGLVVVRKVEPSNAAAIGRSILKSMGLECKENCFPFSLSGGEQQRVAIARALAMEPSILLLDEITSSLDIDSARSVIGIIKKLSTTGISMIIVTHQRELVREIADRVYLMANGEMVECSRNGDIFT